MYMRIRWQRSLITAAALMVMAFGGLTFFAHSAPARLFVEPTAPKERLVAHEWGTFTSIAGKDGVALEWRPLNSVSDLPKFVHTMQTGGSRRGPNRRASKGDLQGTIRMETPVIYFYSNAEMDVSAKVGFPKGTVTEWYPHARTAGTGIDWGRFKVIPGANDTYPVEQAESHYYPARETDAASVRVCGVDGKENETEKFLFYRGVGTFDLPLSVRVDGGQIVLENVSQQQISHLLIFENRGGQIGFRVCDAFMGSMTHERPALDSNVDEVLQNLERILVAEGLYEKEARAMVNTWRSSWFEEGTRVFYILPRVTTDELLPLTLDPAPAELVRVLVGRAEVITPEMEQQIRTQVSRLGSSSANERLAATTNIQKYGRFAEPILKRLPATETDVRMRERITQLIRS